MTARRTQHRHRCARLRAFGDLDAWCLASAGVEAQQVVSVGPTKWTVCYKVHVIPSRRTLYQGQHHTMAEDTTEPRTSWMAPSSRQEQLVSGMPARATPVWLPRELALKSLRSFRRFLENLKGLQRSGKRNTLSGTPEEGIASQPWPANKPLERTGVNARADIVGASAGRSAPSHPLGRDSCRDPAAALLSSRSLSGR